MTGSLDHLDVGIANILAPVKLDVVQLISSSEHNVRNQSIVDDAQWGSCSSNTSLDWPTLCGCAHFRATIPVSFKLMTQQWSLSIGGLTSHLKDQAIECQKQKRLYTDTSSRFSKESNSNLDKRPYKYRRTHAMSCAQIAAKLPRPMMKCLP